MSALLSILHDTTHHLAPYTLPIVTAVLVIAYLYKISARLPKGCKLAHPAYMPFVGILPGIIQHFDHAHEFALLASREVGEEKTYGWSIPKLFGRPIRFLTLGATEANAEHVLKTNMQNYVKGEQFRETLYEFLQNGIFNVDGVQWQKTRKIASHVFTSRNIKTDMTAVFTQNAQTLVQRLDKYASQGNEFDIQDLFFRYTLESFAEIAFGERPGLLDDNAHSMAWAKAYDVVQTIATSRFTSATWEVKRALRIGDERTLTKNIAIINAYAASVIAKRKANNDAAVSDKPDLLSRFIAYSIEHNERLTDADLRDVVINFIVAGRDTTACLLSWSTYELTQHPEWEVKLYAAIRGVMTKADDATAGFEQCAGLPLVQAFLHESLRLHPSVPMDSKEAVNDDVLPDGTPVPAGTSVGYSPYMWGRSKAMWGEDSDEFKPDRWLTDSTRTGLIEVSQFKFLSFNAGPRLCLGKSVALHEAGLLLSNLISRYQFTLRPKYDPLYAITITLPMKNGLPVTLKRRQTTV